jgi:predicted dehydrogenase
LIELADRRDLRLMVGHTFEYNPAVRALREIIQRGELGQIYYVDSVRANLGLFQRDLNVLWDLAPHDVSILMYILGRDPIAVSAQGGAHIFEDKHDLVYLNLAFPGNILAHVHVSWIHPSKIRRITVVGSRKMVVYDDVETLEKIKIYDKGVEAPPYTDTFGEFQCSYRYGDVVIPNIRFTEPLRVECQHFLECITDRREPQSSGRVGYKVVKVLEMAERSLKNGGMQETMHLVEGTRDVREHAVA